MNQWISCRALSRYKDGTEVAGETNNELSLTSLGSNDGGLYQCSAKVTADMSLPAVRSEEAMLTITGTEFIFNGSSQASPCCVLEQDTLTPYSTG